MDVFKTLIHSQPGAVGSTVAITGGSINGTNIGATTPGTGAFTTLTASGATTVTNTTDSTSTTTGALIVSGGLGVAKKSNFGDQLTISHASSAVGLASTTNADSTAYWAFTPQSGTGKSFSVGVGGPGSTVDGGALANKFFVRNNSTGGYSMLIDGTSNATTLAGSIIIPTSTPASAAASGTAGTIAWDSSYIYVCTGTNQWKRVAIATW